MVNCIFLNKTKIFTERSFVEPIVRFIAISYLKLNICTIIYYNICTMRVKCISKYLNQKVNYILQQC